MISIVKRTMLHSVLSDRPAATYVVEVAEWQNDQPEGLITLHANNERDAYHLMETLRLAVVAYTTDVPTVEGFKK